MDYKTIGEVAQEAQAEAQGSEGAPVSAVASSAHPAVERVKTMLGNAGSAVKDFLPDVSKVYVDPISPGADITLSDRWHLILREAKPWGEFFALSQFNLPPWSQIKVRIGHNITTYFYNYLLLTLLHCVLFAVLHFGTVLTALLLSAALYALFVWKKEDIPVTSDFSIDHTGKVVIAVILTATAIFFGDLLALFFSIGFFLAVVVGIHATFRDDVTDDDATVV